MPHYIRSKHRWGSPHIQSSNQKYWCEIKTKFHIGWKVKNSYKNLSTVYNPTRISLMCILCRQEEREAFQRMAQQRARPSCVAMEIDFRKLMNIRVGDSTLGKASIYQWLSFLCDSMGTSVVMSTRVAQCGSGFAETRVEISEPKTCIHVYIPVVCHAGYTGRIIYPNTLTNWTFLTNKSCFLINLH